MGAMINRGRVAVVLGRRGLSAILLAVAGLVFYTVFLTVLATEPSAQTDGDDTGGEVSASQVGQSDEGCANPQALETFTGTESQRTPTFNITGNTLRISFETEATNPDAVDENLAIRVLDEAGSFVDSVLVLQPEVGSDNIFIDPGTYSLQIDAGQEVRYSVTVEDCVGENSSPAEQSTPAQNPSNQNARPRRNDVIRNTIPRRRLPPTGGLSTYAMVTGSILVGTCLLGLGLVVRRGSRD